MILLNHLQRLSGRHDIDMISFGSSQNSDALAELSRWCKDVRLVQQPSKWRVLFNSVAAIAHYVPFGVAAAQSNEMTAVVSRRLTETNYDAVIFQLPEMAQYQPDWFQGPSVWNLEDPPVLKSQRMLPLYPWYAKPWVWDRIARRKRYEKRWVGRFGCILFVNEEDSRDYMSIFKETNFDWVPSGIDVDAFRPTGEVARNQGMIVMSGNMFHKPNVDAVEHFCSEVFPLVCMRSPTAALWLVGANPAPSVRKWSKNPRIHVTGFVSDVSSYLRKAEVSVCPVRLRIGTQTKVLEALACGTPVVTTSAGNHGIGAVSGEHLYVADDPYEFADRILSFLNGDRWNEFSENGHRFVAQNFTWEKSTEKLEQVFGRLIAAKTNTLQLVES